MSAVKELPYLEHAQNGVRRVSRDIFTDPDLFEMEFSRIWEKCG